MRALACIFSFISLAGCTSMGGVLSSETTWFQDWSCARQDGVCARTDTIDAITITELTSDPAEAGPVSGYPAESLPVEATPKKLRGIQPLDQDYFEDETHRGRPFLETSFGDEEILAAPAILSDPAFSIDAAFDDAPTPDGANVDDLFGSVFPQAAVGAQFAVLSAKMGLSTQIAEGELQPTEFAESDARRITRTIVRRDGVPVPEDERVTELVIDPRSEIELATFESVADVPDLAQPVSAEDADIMPDAVPVLLPKTPRRKDAKVLPVVISPYVDARGIYHERSVIWVEVEPADWVVE